MIPKILHQIWITKDAFPVKYHAWRASWLRHNPDWTLILWTREMLLKLALLKETRNLLGKIHWVIETDLMRWELGRLFGGVIADTDAECCAPFEPLLRHDAFTCAYWFAEWPTGLGCLGLTQGNQLAVNILKKTCKFISSDIQFANGRLSSAGQFQSRLMLNCPVILPKEVFYPYDSDHIKPDGTVFGPPTMSIHHYTGKDPDGWTHRRGEYPR